MNIHEDLKQIDNSVSNFHRHDEVDAYRIVEPTETLLRQTCARMTTLQSGKAQNCYDSDLSPQIKKFTSALNAYSDNQDFQALRHVMKQVQESVKEFNQSVDYLIRTGLVSQQNVIIIPQNQQNPAPVPPLRRKQQPDAEKKQKSTASAPPKRRPAPAKKSFDEKYFSDENAQALLNKNIELVIKITAEETENGSTVVQYYLANKNAFRRKDTYPNFWNRLFRKNKIVSYQQAFRVSDWKPLFPEKNLPEEYLSLSKNIFGIPHEGNLQDDGLLLKIRRDSLLISFKTYGERASKSLTSEFSGQTQQTVELLRKDFTEKNEKDACHYQDTISFYHQFNHVHSEWNQKEVLVKMKIDMKLK